MFEDPIASSNVMFDGKTTEELSSKEQQQILGVLRCGQDNRLIRSSSNSNSKSRHGGLSGSVDPQLLSDVLDQLEVMKKECDRMRLINHRLKRDLDHNRRSQSRSRSRSR